MGTVFSESGDLLGGNAQNGRSFKASGTPIDQPTTVDQANQVYDQTQAGLGAQQALMQALQNQNGIQNQSNVYNQVQGVANGTGPNPAQAQLNQSTTANIANQAALMAGQRGSGANAGLLARQAALQGGNLQQQAAGQGATMQANQSLNALGQLGTISGQQVQNQAGAVNNYNQAAQGLQGNVLNSINSQNNANVAMQSNINNAQSGLAQTNANNAAKGTTGLVSGGGSLLSLAHGGEVPTENPKLSEVPKADRYPNHVMSSDLQAVASLYHPQRFAFGGVMEKEGPDVGTSQFQAPAPKAKLLAFGGPVTMSSPNSNSGNSNAIPNTSPIGMGDGKEASSSPGSKNTSKNGTQSDETIDKGPDSSADGTVGEDTAGGAADASDAGAAAADAAVADEGVGALAALANKGMVVPGKAKVSGDSEKNDKVPALLSPKEIVLPRSVTMAEDAPEQAKMFVAALMKKHNGSLGKEHSEFKSALQKAIAGRKGN